MTDGSGKPPGSPGGGDPVRSGRRKDRRITRVALFQLSTAGVLVVAALIAVLWNWLELSPPSSIRFAAGTAGGGYYQVAERYREILAEDGIAVEIVETAGSVENVARIASGEADIALVQAGVPLLALPDGELPETIASVFLEPVLIFVSDRAEAPNFLPEWRGLRIATGPEGSGARFALSSIGDEMGLARDENQLVPIGGRDAADALLAGEVDGAVFVAPLDAPYLAPLLASRTVRLVSIENRDGLARRLPELIAADLPAGVLDYDDRIPPVPLKLLAIPARIIARDDLHPAAVNRLVRAMRILHSSPSVLSQEGQFPVQRPADTPLNTYAGAQLREGESPLAEILPYWIVAQLNRFLLLLLPVLFVVVPLLRMVPALYHWMVRLRILRHDQRLREIDLSAAHTTDVDVLHGFIADLNAIDDTLRQMRVPVGFKETLYLCRSHVGLIRSRVLERLGEVGAPGPDA